MASVYLPIISLNRSQNIRIGKQSITSQNLSNGVPVPVYVDISDAAVRRDLQRHSALGSYLVVGPLTTSNVDEIVHTGCAPSVTGGSLVTTVAAGELLVRSTGAVIGVAGGTQTSDAADGTKDRTDLVWVDGTSGATGLTKGTLATAGQSVAPDCPAGKVPIVSVKIAAGDTKVVVVKDLRPRA